MLLQCNYDKKNSVQRSAFQHVHPQIPASKKSLVLGPRARAYAAGFTLVEVMISTVLLSMIILGILAVLIGSYRVAAKARYNDHARYIAKSFADQFLTQQSVDTSGNTITLFVPTSSTGLGLTWVTTDPTTGAQTTVNGTAEGLPVFLSDASTGEAPLEASVTRQVWNIDPTTGAPITQQVTDAAGSLLRGDFTVTFTYPQNSPQGVKLSQTISAIRSIP